MSAVLDQNVFALYRLIAVIAIEYHVFDKLILQWRTTSLVFAGGCLLFYQLTYLPHRTGGADWFWLSVPALLYVLGFSRRHLIHNHRVGEPHLLPSLGVGTALTLTRGLLFGLLAGFLAVPEPSGLWAWLPATLYLTASLTDLVDGYIARSCDHVTRLGGLLDVETDSLGILIATALSIHFDRLPGWFMVTGLLYYLYRLGLYLRVRLGRRTYEVPYSAHRRLIGGCQVGFLFVVLWPVYGPPETTIAGVLFLVPVLISFGRDWLIAAGYLQAQDPGYIVWKRRLKRFMRFPMAPAARLVTVIAVIVLLFERVSASPELPFDGWLYPAGFVLSLLLGTAVMLGVWTRLFALVLLAAACVDIAYMTLGPPNGLLMGGCITVLLLGGGRWVLDNRDEQILLARDDDATLLDATSS